MSPKTLNYFSDFEQDKYQRFARFRLKLYRPLLIVLDKLRFRPAYLSILGLLSMIGFVYFLPINIYYAILFVILHMLFDSLDGSLARFQKTTSNTGALIDIITDHLVLLTAITATAFYQITDPTWSLAYALLYIPMIALITFANYKKIPIIYVFRTKYLFFLFLLIDGHFQTNILNPFITIIAIYMTVINLYLIAKIQNR